jgi:hypothetical protein
VATIERRENEVGEDLDGSDFDRDRLVLADVHGHVVLALQLRLQQPDDTVVLELFAHGTHEDWAHMTSRDRNLPE